ncbi:MAG TPA: family 20 glycosylhydrolase [Candidatus Limnocylindrales bacterium]|nr:family 20 glycosylhydrolase [Candidatus Limnocylindrales bacterium]
MRHIFSFRSVLFLSLFSLLITVKAVRAQSSAELNVMPMPAKVQQGGGALKIDTGFTVAFAGFREPRLDRAGQRFLVQLSCASGIPVVQGISDPAKATLVVTTDHESKAIQEPGEDESYSLEVTSSGAKLHAVTPLGAIHGLQTLLQLVSISPGGFVVPAVSIQDQPRFVWRGLMIDSARHFIPLPVVRRNLDGMEAVKMNVLHWHLSDNQGFRVESRKFPKLQESGSDGFYYTQDEIRDVIAYARDRGIRVVPEFDMPGHSTAWFVGYPDLGSGPGPYHIERDWGVFDPAMNPADEKTYKFLNDFIAEMAKLFPDSYFHIGGDEVNGKEWDANPKIQEFKKAHGMKTNVELQAYFSQRVQELVTKHGKTPVGWDEIFVPGAPKNIVIHSWRGPEALAAAAKQGYRGILSNGYYIDLGWSAARHYANDPLGGAAENLTDEEKARILGGESTMWSEFVNEENIDSRIWPRNAAIAERLWSPQNTTDVASMYRRMEAESARLEWLGLTHRSYMRLMLQRMAGPASDSEIAALLVLTKALEHVKDYSREFEGGAEPTSQSPLNRLVDAVGPESEVSRVFSGKVDAFLASSCRDDRLAAELRAQLAQWAEVDGQLQALAQRSALVKDAAPASAALSQAAELALTALERIRQGLPSPDALKKQQIDALNAFESQAHKSQMTIPARAAFQKLIEAASSGGTCVAPR